MDTFYKKVMDFYKQVDIYEKLPDGIELMNPYQNPAVLDLVDKFYKKFYSDHNNRYLILGINPGRFGAGVTGIPFTDPVRLYEACDIDNTLNKKPETSSKFVYEMIHAYGGVESFYNTFFIGAVSPLGFVKDGKNLNYYDSRELKESLAVYILEQLKQQIRLGCRQDVCICWGEGANYKYLQGLNKKENLFDEIIPLPHPRYIMQYKFKMKESYIQQYLSILGQQTSSR